MNWKQALALGLCSVGEFKKEPVAYLYNGVRLGKLPVVEGYPYAVISTLFGRKALLLAQQAPYFDSSTSKVRIPGNSILYGYFGISWDYNGEATSRAFDGDSLIWTSHDILNDTDGSVFLKATAPVPVYE